ncbi:MAG: hypothetical protein ACI9W4_002519 [Rhodothermales bacterium]|jgi:hypothetical protein
MSELQPRQGLDPLAYTEIPVAVMSIALFRSPETVGVTSTLLEANMSQTVGSASSSLASGIIFTLPALYMWGFNPAWGQMTLLALCGWAAYTQVAPKGIGTDWAGSAGVWLSAAVFAGLMGLLWHLTRTEEATS